MPLKAGTCLGPYEVTAQIGVGGMGEVYRATDRNLARSVAIKVLPEAVAGDSERLARFDREAKTLAALNHPNIAQIYGLERSEGTTALVMELVEGPTLAERIAAGPIAVEEALPIARQIAEALEAAHEQGIVHRDLKPANIKVRPDGTVKVLDFGLAKALESGAGTREQGSPGAPSHSLSPTITTPAMTQAGMILGTAAYMSPEQAKGRPADKRSDVWAFGAVLYEMLAGKRAFHAEDVSETLAAVLMKEPEWAALPSATPPAVVSVLRCCLQRDRKRRARDIGDVALALDGAFETVRIVVPDAGASRSLRPATLWAAVAVVVAVALAGAVAWRQLPAAPGPVTRFSHQLGTQAFTRSGRHLLAISPDGGRIAYVADEQIYLRSLSDPVAHPIPGTAENPNSPAFSPDGEWIAYYAGAEIRKIAASGGTPVPLVEAGNPFGISWERDNTILYGQRDGIWRVPADGGAAERVVAAADGEWLTGARLLPGGETVLFAQSKTGSEEWSVVVQRITTGERTVVRPGASPHYVPTGHLVFALGETLLAQPFDAESLQTRGGPVPVVPQVRRALVTGLSHYAVADSGTLIYATGLDRNDPFDLALVDRAGTVTRLPGSRATVNTRARLSPDDARIAAARTDQVPANVWIYDVRDAQWRQLTFDGGADPIWTPDGRAITYLWAGALWQVAADFSSAPEQLAGTEVPGLVGPEAWSPDGTVLLFSSPAGLHAFNAEQKQVSLVLPTPARADGIPDAAFSPDGRWVAYSTLGDDRYVAISPYPFGQGSPRKVSDAPSTRPIWARTGREVIFNLLSGGVRAVEVTTEPTLTWKNPTTVFETSVVTGGAGANDLSADGQRILVTARPAGEDERLGSPEIQVVLNWTEELKRLVPR